MRHAVIGAGPHAMSNVAALRAAGAGEPGGGCGIEAVDRAGGGPLGMPALVLKGELVTEIEPAHGGGSSDDRTRPGAVAFPDRRAG
jgi:hypothetical protein